MRAASYRAVRVMHGINPVADIRADADASSARIDQLISGEIFEILDQDGDQVWGRARRDGVVGWMAAADLKAGAPLPTHRVAMPGGPLPLNAFVAGEDASFAPIGQFDRDPVAVAERLLGVPHSLGARSSVSTDCAGLVQQALYACGLPGPRYADLQAQLGRAVARTEARRGDLVIWLHAEGGPGWTGHSAFMLDADRVIHATGDKGAVTIESLAEADARYRADDFAEPVFRRL